MVSKQFEFDFTNFRNYMTEKGINERFISLMTGIPEESLRSRLSGETDFSMEEMRQILRLFRALFEGNQSPDLADKLFFQAVKIA